MHDTALTPSRQAVHALFGRCLLRLQQYELLTKRMLATGSVTSNLSGWVPPDTKLAKSLPTSTLGLLVGEFFRTVVVIEGSVQDNESVTAKAAAEITITTKLRIEMSAQDHESARQQVAELVELRNTLAHHFIGLFDLWSEAGCMQAREYLDTACERIGRDLEQLQGWARSMDASRRSAIAALQSEVFVDLFDNGIGPDGIVDWERAGIADCLVEAAMALDEGGWTPLSVAIAFIEDRYPEQTPRKYGCHSWAQVINESKRFDLEYTAVESEATKVARFRERKPRNRRGN